MVTLFVTLFVDKVSGPEAVQAFKDRKAWTAPILNHSPSGLRRKGGYGGERNGKTVTPHRFFVENR